MKYIKKYYKNIILLIVLIVFATTLPIINKDWILYNTNIQDISILDLSFLSISKSISLVLSKYYIIKVTFIPLIILFLFISIKNFINNKNNSLIFIGISLFFLTNYNILYSSLSVSNILYNLVPFFLFIIIINLILKDLLYKVPKVLIIILGLIASIFSLNYGLIILMMLVSTYLIKLYNKENNKYILMILIGVILGNVINFSIYDTNIFTFNIYDITKNIMHTIVPTFMNINFIFTLIIMISLFINLIKLYSSNKINKMETIILVLITSLYPFATLLSSNLIINYISFILFNMSTYFILIKISTNSLKERINLIYIFKVLYIILISLLKEVPTSYFISYVLIDIIIILEFVNKMFKDNQLIHAWFIVTVLSILLEIHVNSELMIKNKYLNAFLYRDLSCEINRIVLPNKYKKNNYDMFIPTNDTEKVEYLKYLEIDSTLDYEIITKE